MTASEGARCARCGDRLLSLWKECERRGEEIERLRAALHRELNGHDLTYCPCELPEARRALEGKEASP